MLVTQIVSSMTVTLCMLIDSIMIGRFLGVDSMSAYGLASPLLLIFAAFGSLISSGVQVMCGKTVGLGDREATDAVYSASVFLAGTVSAVGLALVFLFLQPLTTLLGAGKPGPDNQVFDLTRDYITGFMCAVADKKLSTSPASSSARRPSSARRSWCPICRSPAAGPAWWRRWSP